MYPFPVKTLAQELKKFKKNARFFWCQEEPQNMGAWNSARNYIEWTLNYIKAENRKVSYIGRKPAASPATGYLKKHLAQQKENNRKGTKLIMPNQILVPSLGESITEATVSKWF